jgi:HEPN domain-containing protein
VGGEAWGRSVASLMDTIPDNVRPSNLGEEALELDQAYIPSRYPNVHPAGFPGSTYTRKMAERLVGYARRIVMYCQEAVQRREQ